MALTLGKTFNRNYRIRVPFLDGYYDIGLFYNTRSPFLLFGAEQDFTLSNNRNSGSIQTSMFKNLESSKFCETFLELHNYKGTNLDIVNQFKEIRESSKENVSLFLNENITLSKITVFDKEFSDVLVIYGFNIVKYLNEYLFIISERQSIVSRLNKKVVRTTAIQIATPEALKSLDEHYLSSKKD